MNKIRVHYPERANDIQLERMEIVTDQDNPNKIEIYMLDDAGQRIEGGTFDAGAFMLVVKKFYNDNY